MIGKKIRSYNHLFKNLTTNEPQMVSVSNGSFVIFGSIVKTICDNNEIIVFFNNSKGERCGNVRQIYDNNDVDKLKCQYRFCIVIYQENFISFFAKYIVLLPNDFNEQYDLFINKNKKLLSDLVSSFYDSNDVKYLFIFFHEQPNLYAWALKNRLKNMISFGELINIFDWQKNYSQLVNKIKKGTITAYNKMQDITSMYDEMVLIRREKRAKDVINTFNTAQKKLLKTIELDDKMMFILNRFSTLSEQKKKNFIRKMSTVEDVNEILKQMSFAINLHFDWNYNSFMDYLTNSDALDYEMVYDNNNVVIVQCNNYETVKHLGKTTNWCISKNKTYWNNYINTHNGQKQYVMFNFNELEDSEYSIIGFTSLGDCKISHAHSFTNNNLVMDNKYIGTLQSFTNPSINISSILSNLGIDYINLFSKQEKKYNWDKNSVIKYLDDSLGNDNGYDVLFDDNDTLVISTNSRRVPTIVNDKIYNLQLNRYRNMKHIFFFDFSKNENDPTRIIFVLINKNNESVDEFPFRCYNATCECIGISFDSLLDKYNMPYDVICRTEDNMIKFKDAMINFDTNMLNKLLSDDKIKESILNKKYSKFIGYSDIFDRFYISLFECRSLDLISLFYNHGITLSSLLKKCDIDSLIDHIIENVIEFGGGSIPTQEEINDFNNNKIFDTRKKLLVGFFLSLDMIVNKETKFDLINMFYSVRHFNFNHTLVQYIFEHFFDKINFSKKNDLSQLVFEFCVENKNIEYLDKIMKMENLHQYFKDGIISYSTIKNLSLC